uniref:Uncharacterized protein n=1 Tax=Knipowitschia caucasica TaxID=637954 RepID=A0AAV2J4Q6_KNICA
MQQTQVQETGEREKGKLDRAKRRVGLLSRANTERGGWLESGEGNRCWGEERTKQKERGIAIRNTGTAPRGPIPQPRPSWLLSRRALPFPPFPCRFCTPLSSRSPPLFSPPRSSSPPPSSPLFPPLLPSPPSSFSYSFFLASPPALLRPFPLFPLLFLSSFSRLSPRLRSLSSSLFPPF